MPPPLLTLTFDPEVGMGVACDLGYPCAKFRLPRPFGFRVRADVRDIRQTDGRTTDADDRLMPPPPLWGRGHNNTHRGAGEVLSDGLVTAIKQECFKTMSKIAQHDFCRQ